MTDDALVEAQRWMWAIGDYSAIAQRLLPLSVDLIETVGVGEGDRVLDVAVGDGNAAVEAARRGARVTGIDLTPAQIDRARARVEKGGLDVELHVGNAEALPFDDDAYDTVVSVMGVIFAPDHARAAAEMARVCRPGGTVAVTSWADEGWGPAWRARATDLVPVAPATPAGGSGGPDPDAWGDPDELRRRLEAVGLDVEVHRREFHWSFPTSEETADFFLANAGPFIAFTEAATAAGNGDKVRGRLVDALDSVNQAVDGSCRAPAPYLLAVARKP